MHIPDSTNCQIHSNIQYLPHQPNFPPPVLKTYDSNNEILNQILNNPREEERALAQMTLAYLGSHYYDWDISDLRKFNFDLPPSNFLEDNESAVVKVKLPEIDEKIECKKLSDEQLKSIWSFGQFSVASNFQNINHIWKVSGFLISGFQRRKKIFMKYASKGLYFLFKIGSFYDPTAFFKRKDKLLKSMNLFSALGQFISFFIDLFDLFFGSPTYILNYSLSSLIEEEIERLRSGHLSNKNFSETLIIADFLQVVPKEQFLQNNCFSEQPLDVQEQKYKLHKERIMENWKKIEDIHNASEKYWADFFNKAIEEFDDVEENEFEKQEKRLKTMNFAKKIEFIKTSLDLENDLLVAVVNKLEAYAIFEEELFALQNELVKAQTDIDIALKKKHPFKSRVFFWMRTQSRRLFHQKSAELNDITFKKIMERLANSKNQENFELFEESINFLKSLEKTMDQIKKRVVQKNKSPALQITFRRKMYPPYKISTHLNSEGQRRYSLQKYTSITIKSNILFFRQYADILRFFYWTMQLTYKFARYAINGKFGLKGLLYWKIYFRGFQINELTGEVLNNWDKVVPVSVRFQKILRGMAKSRTAFEISPDNGFLGKNLGRVFNLIECYLIRFFFVGVIGVLIFHSLFNILFTIFCFALALTIFLWIIIWLFLRNLIRIFLYDWENLDSRAYHSSGRVSGTFQLLKHSHRLFPLPAILLQFLFKGILKILLIILLTLLYPVLAILMFALSCLIYIFKLFYDSFTFFLIIKISGKVPTRDTNLATRIAGPGISRNLFWSISTDDAIILIQSFLESQQLDHIQQRLTEKIMKPINSFSKHLVGLMGPFLTQTSDNLFKRLEALKTASDSLKKNLDKQIAERRKILPGVKFFSQNASYKIKFTNRDIEEIKGICIEMLKLNLPLMDLDDFTWTKFNVKQGKFKLLMAKVLKEVLGSNDIFESVEEADQRIFLEEEKSQSIFKSQLVKRILKGKVLLDNFQPHEKNLRATNEQLFIPTTSLIDVKKRFADHLWKIEWYRHMYFRGSDRKREFVLKE